MTMVARPTVTAAIGLAFLVAGLHRVHDPLHSSNVKFTYKKKCIARGRNKSIASTDLNGQLRSRMTTDEKVQSSVPVPAVRDSQATDVTVPIVSATAPLPPVGRSGMLLKGDDIVLVTALSDSHLCALTQLLVSLNESTMTSPMVVYDLNPVSPHLRLKELQRIYSLVVEVRRFDYTAHPPFFDVTRKAGHWAWKPIIIKSVVDEFGACLWLDTGALLLRGRSRTALAHVQRQIMKGDGFYSAPSRGTPYQFVHVGTWLHFGLRKCCNNVDSPRGSRESCCCCGATASRPCMNCHDQSQMSNSSNTPKSLVDANMTAWRQVYMCNGAIIGFSRRGRAYADLLLPWVECANDERCIAPPGSSRSNHRQDQAALTMLAELRDFACRLRSIEVGFALHKDEIVNHSRCEALLGHPARRHKRIW